MHGVALEFIVVWEPIEKCEFALEYILCLVHITNVQKQRRKHIQSQNVIRIIDNRIGCFLRKIKRGGKVWINVFPDKSYTKKPAETRMGSGKGSPEGWVAVVKPGRVMFELAGVPEPLAREAIRLAGHKLPVKTKFVTAEDEA